MKTIIGPSDVLFPVPAALVVTGTMERPNIATVAWIGMMSSDPHVIGISLKNSRYTLELLRRHRQFTVNIPQAGMCAEVDYCGIVTGRKRDKFADCGFTPLPGTQVAPPIIEECPFNLECAVVRELEFHDYTAVFGEILETHVDSDKISGTAPKGIDIAKIDPLVYCATVREYWSIGEKLGDSFHSGKEMVKKFKNGGS